MKFKNLIEIFSKSVDRNSELYLKSEIEFITKSYESYGHDIKKTVEHIKKESRRCLDEFYRDSLSEGKKIYDTEELFLELYKKYNANKC